MKRVLFILLLLVFLPGCVEEKVETNVPRRNYEHIQFTSQVKKEECVLCGEETDHVMSSYFGQNNLGLVDINTFDVKLIETNRYDEQGDLIEKADGHMYFESLLLHECCTFIVHDPDRGYAQVDIDPKGSGVDPEAINEFLCQECLDSFSGHYFEDDDPPEIAVVNFATREIRPLVRTCSWFITGDYAVACWIKETGGIALGIYFVPERYQS